MPREKKKVVVEGLLTQYLSTGFDREDELTEYFGITHKVPKSDNFHTMACKYAHHSWFVCDNEHPDSWKNRLIEKFSDIMPSCWVVITNNEGGRADGHKASEFMEERT